MRPMRTLAAPALAVALLLPSLTHAQRYTGADGKLRVSLAQQPFSPNGTSVGPRTMAQGGIQQILSGLGATIRVQEAALTADENTEYGGRKRPRLGRGHFSGLLSISEKGGAFPPAAPSTLPPIPA